jgi:hypothetical protein
MIASLGLLTLVSLQSNAEYAPKPFEVNGNTIAPIDIIDLEGKVVFDFESQAAYVGASMNFQMLNKGMPLFDLRQSRILSVSLNDEEIELSKILEHDFGKATGKMRILEMELEPGIDYNLSFHYIWEKPDSPSSQGIKWAESGMTYDTYYSDLNPGRYLEQWFPANLLFDQHPFKLDIELQGTEQKHLMITNGAITEKKEHHWMLSFPENSTAFSHMIVIVPENDVDVMKKEAKIGKEVFQIDVYKRKDAPNTTKVIWNESIKSLNKYVKSMGDWIHGNDYIVYVWPGSRAMEYDGSTTTTLGALDHEVFHSWFGRGVKPASQNDGWWDEAFTVYYADERRPNRRVVTKQGKPVTLCSDNPLNRITPGSSYTLGAVFFGRIAHLIGHDNLEKHMASFYKKYAGKVASTADMENHLIESTGNKKIKDLFSRYVYGRE